ncbi:MAG: hypothetical protein ACK5O7_00450 [Holosporales bacterium]
MRRAALFSAILHFIVFLIALIGLPSLPKRDPDLITPVPVEVVTLSDRTRSPKPVLNPKPTEEPKEQPKPEEKKPLPTPSEPEAEKKVEEKPKEPVKPEEKPIEQKPEEVLPKPKEEKPKDKPKEEPKKQPEVKKEPEPKKKPKKTKSFDSVLKNLAESEPEQSDDVTDEKSKEKAASNQAGDVGDEPTADLSGFVRAQVMKCWNVPAAVKNASSLDVRVEIQLNLDGSVISSRVLDSGRAARDPMFRVAAESALRAVKDPRCVPLKLPAERYNDWKKIEIHFNPKDF